MSDSPALNYRVDRVPAVVDQIYQLADVARSVGFIARLVASLSTGLDRLTKDPQKFGEPAFRTRHEGGVAYRGSVWPILFHYVVFEAERIVILQKVLAMPRSPLDR